jgi:glycosyltransferase involved in cell wall biosynthesis
MNEQSNYREISDPLVMALQPLVSVHMLAYRHEHFIVDAIEGVIAQQCDFPIELVIGEDCSPDGTLKVISDYQRRFPALIRIISSNANVGLQANSARCQEACRGRYIAFCEGDDYWISPNKLARQVAILRSRPDITLVCHAANEVDYGGVANRSLRCARKSRQLTGREIVSGDGGFIPTCSIVTRRSLFESKPTWWVHAPVTDYPMVLRAAQLGQVIYLDERMSAYRVNVPHSWSSTYQQQDALERRYAHALAICSMLDGFDSETEHHFARSVRFIIRRYLYDAVSRSSASKGERYRHARQVAPRLTAYDRLFLFLGIVWNKRLTRLRELPEKSLNLLSSLIDDLSKPSFHIGD